MKVVKFGGSSMADAGQYRKVRDILLADPERKVVVVSAAGKRFSGDHKLTDLLYLCYSHVKYGVDCSRIFDMITQRYLDIRNELGLQLELEPEFEDLKRRINAKNISREELNISADELTERFVRGDASRNTEGSGLGLNIAKSLMELQRGQLQLLVDGDLFKASVYLPKNNAN